MEAEDQFYDVLWLHNREYIVLQTGVFIALTEITYLYDQNNGD